ncbi:MAG: histone deacetylase [Deltaproteobacteria bacterium]|nr:histone deacetylase [Deltaproteobacteria bacterium]
MLQRLLQRRRARSRLEAGEVGIWYHPDYVLSLLEATARVANVEPRRGELILGRLMQAGLLKSEDVRTPPLATMSELTGFHPLSYLDRSLSPEYLGRVFGLEAHFLKETDPIITNARRQVGATVEAARLAAAHRGFIGMNLGGGFHHAEPEQGSGFCVYNDIGVAICALRQMGYDRPIAVVDLDYHQGNGNSVAFVDDPSVLVYSIHGSVWSHLEGSEHEIHLTGTVTDRLYLAALRTTLQSALQRHRPGLIFYIAGTDVLANDRLGSFWLSLEGCLVRDRFVVDTAAGLGASLVVTLGGGYSKLAWISSFYLARYLLAGVAHVERVPRVDVRTDFTRIARQLDTGDLTGEEDSFDITEEDVYGDLTGGGKSRRLLDFYSAQGVELAFERYGIMAAVTQRGFDKLRMDTDFKDPSHQVVRMFGRRPPAEEEHLLLELVVRRLWLPSVVPELERMEVLFVEWMLLQDPTRGFTLDKPPLPGQRHPGLGISLHMQELLVQACRRLHLHGLFERPARFHNGLGGSSDAHFLDPIYEGRFRALLTVLAGIAPAEASTAVDKGVLKLADGTPVMWKPELHGVPVSEALVAYFESDAYRQAARAALASYLERGLHVDDSMDLTGRV